MIKFWDDEDEDELEDDAEESVEDEEEDEEESDEEVLARIEAAFRSERAKIRASEDIAALRTMRSSYEEWIAGGEVSEVPRMRALDLIEEINDRITDLKAKRLAEKER